MSVELWLASAARGILVVLLICRHAVLLPSFSIKAQVVLLADLPLEMFSLIYKRLDKSSMRALRLTCKGLLKCMDTCNTRIGLTIHVP